jgi:acylphosphatase
MKEEDEGVHVLIQGRVQGVWFRASTKQKAEQLGLLGWVRNTADGHVEAVFEGNKQKIEEMIQWCHQGPPLSKVKNVQVTQQNPTYSFEDFSIRY